MTESGSKAIWYCACITIFLTVLGALYAGWIYDQPNKTHYGIWIGIIGFVIVFLFGSFVVLRNQAVQQFKQVYRRKVPTTEKQREIVQRNVNHHLKNAVLAIEAAESEAENFMADIRPKSTLDDGATNQALESLANHESKIVELREALAFKKNVAAKVNFEVLGDLELRNLPA